MLHLNPLKARLGSRSKVKSKARKKIRIDGNFDDSSLVSAEVVISNEDLIREIFLHLPPKTLIRFKLLSKHWSSIISDPQFAFDRTRLLEPYSIAPLGLFICLSDYYRKKTNLVSLVEFSPSQSSKLSDPSLSFLDNAARQDQIRILQSCNGLLFCQFKHKIEPYRPAIDLSATYCVCNPTTKRYKILPKLIPNNPAELVYGLTLAFDPSKSPYYKVVSFGSRVYIYSSVTRKWSTSTCPSYQLYRGSFHYLSHTGFYWNGSIYCMEGASYSTYRLFEYDIKEDFFKEVNMPQTRQSLDKRTFKYLGESKGHLHFVFVGTPYAKTFKVLEKQKSTSEWLVKYRVNIGQLLSDFPEIIAKKNKTKDRYSFHIVSIYKGEKEEDSALVLIVNRKVISYNFHDKTSKVLRELPADTTYSLDYTWALKNSRGFNFIESLASVNMKYSRFVSATLQY